METPEILITASTTLICSSLSSLLTWILSRKKYQSEVKGNDINNMQHSLDFYEDLSDDHRSRLHSLLDENKELREENIRIREENAAIRVENAASQRTQGDCAFRTANCALFRHYPLLVCIR